MKTKYMIIKQSKTGRIYVVHIESDSDLGAHIVACFKHTEELILSVTRVLNN